GLGQRVAAKCTRGRSLYGGAGVLLAAMDSLADAAARAVGGSGAGVAVAAHFARCADVCHVSAWRLGAAGSDACFCSLCRVRSVDRRAGAGGEALTSHLCPARGPRWPAYTRTRKAAR